MGSIFLFILPTIALLLGLLWVGDLILKKVALRGEGIVFVPNIARGLLAMLFVVAGHSIYYSDHISLFANEFMAATVVCILYATIVGVPIAIVLLYFGICSVTLMLLFVVPVILLIEFAYDLTGSPSELIAKERWINAFPVRLLYVVIVAIFFCIGARIPLFKYRS